MNEKRETMMEKHGHTSKDVMVPVHTYARPFEEMIGDDLIGVLPFSFTVNSIRVRARGRALALEIDATVINVETQEQGRVHHRDEVFYQGGQPGYISHWVRGVLHRMISHEIDECLFANGDRLRDPHANEGSMETRVSMEPVEVKP